MKTNSEHRTFNKFLQIFADHWDKFKSKFPSYDNKHCNKQVAAVLNCGNPEFGFSQYMCLGCGQESKVVAHSCKSKFCLRCGRVDGENVAESIALKLHEDVDYRHLVLTMPEQFRKIFYKNCYSKELYGAFMKMSYDFVKEFMGEIIGEEVECGCLTVLHTVGRKCDYKPHLHVMLMSGGITKEGKWISVKKFDTQALNRIWKEILLNGMRKWDEINEYEKVFTLVERRYPGFYTNIDINPAPKKRRNLIRYLSKYLYRPQISLKRLIKYDKHREEVVYRYNSHHSGKNEVEKTSCETFIGRMLQQILPHRFHRIRYYGLQSPSNRSRLTAKVCEALGKLELLPEVERRSAAPVKASYQELIQIWWSNDPFKCTKCGYQLELVRMWKYGKGWVFNIFEMLFGMDIGPPGELPAFLKAQTS